MCYKLQVTSYKLRVTSYELQVTSYKAAVHGGRHVAQLREPRVDPLALGQHVPVAS